MRLALAQLERRRRRPRREPGADRRRDPRGAARRRRPRRLPRARRHRLPARGPAPAAGLRQGRPRLARRDRARDARGSPRSSAARSSTATSRTRARSSAGRRAAGRLPQALPAELRRLRRAPLLRGRPRAPPAPLRRRARRADDLRGRLAAGAARDRPLARRRAADRQPLRLAVPRRQGRGPRGDARHARARQRVVPRLLQPRRRPGRARLRRPLRRARRRGRGDRPRARASRRRCSSSTSTRPRRSAAGSATCAAASSSAPATSAAGRDRDRPPGAARGRRAGRGRPSTPFAPELEQMRLALGLGIRDYVDEERLPARSCSASPAGSTRR